MAHVDVEINKIKGLVLEMMYLVRTQLQKGREAFFTFNKELALDIKHNEKRVNAYELLVDNDCENFIACFNPVAVDLRFILAILKINYHLERTADNVNGIAKNIIKLDTGWDDALITDLQLRKAFDLIDSMLGSIIESFEQQDSGLARKVFSDDKILDEITDKAMPIVAEHVRSRSNNVANDLLLLLIHRKLERTGDLIKNMAEEIIFYMEAKVIKHAASAAAASVK